MNIYCCVIVIVIVSPLGLSCFGPSGLMFLSALFILEDHDGHHHTPYDLTAYHEGGR